MLPAPTINPGQRQEVYPAYFSRYVPNWQSPGWLDAWRWRRVVANVPWLAACRDTLIMNVLTLDWRITARDPDQSWDYRNDIDYYTELIRDIDDEGYDIHTEKILKDAYDIPFGGCSELGKRNDDPAGRVRWARH